MRPQQQAPADRKEPDVHRHELDVISLGFGLVFAVLGLAWLAVPLGVVDSPPWPGLVWGGVIAVGVALLVDAGRRLARQDAAVTGDDDREPPAGQD